MPILPGIGYGVSGDTEPSSTPDLSSIVVTPSSGPATGKGVESVITLASGVDVGATLEVGGVATPMRRISATSIAFVALAVILTSGTSAVSIKVTNPNGQHSTKASAYTFYAGSALSFTSMTALLAVKDNYRPGTIFDAVDSSGNFIMSLQLQTSGALKPIGYADATKLYLFLDHADYQFADVTGSSNLTVDSDGITADFATGGAVYLKGFLAASLGRGVTVQASCMAGNATPSTNDSFMAGWITNPLVAYTVCGGGFYFNSANWRQCSFSGSSAAAPTVTAASSNMTLTPSAVALESYILFSRSQNSEDGIEGRINGGNAATGWAAQNDGSLCHVTALTIPTSGGNIWHFCFGARSVSTGTARIRITKIDWNFGVFV